jgi:ATP-dependent helicase/nuclease subunit A
MKVSDKALLQDTLARERIEHDLDTSLLVEAGAGSGKTTSLVARMLSLIASGKADANRIAAITFTNKAADELRDRFRMKLERSIRVTDDSQVRLRLEQALADIAETFIGTIHSFCGRLLREQPIEAGLDPNFQEIDEEVLQELLNRHWDEYLIRLREHSEAGVERLAELGVHVEDLRAVFLCVAKYEDVEVFIQPADRPDFDAIRLSLFPLIEEAAASLPANRPDGGWDPLQEAVRNARLAMRHKDLMNDNHVLSLALPFDRSLTVTLKRWPDGAKAKQLKERFEEWRMNVLLPFLQAWREHLHPHLVQFVLPAVVYSRQRRTEEGLLSFQDLLLASTKLLRERPEIRRYFARRYTHLFVDEFQDTDPVQAEMMLLLTGDCPDVNDWRKQRPKSGSLFIVGDPKQSIYRFRRADISTYNYVLRIMEKHGDVLRLTRNFRSVKSIGDFVNYAFEAKFLPPGKPEDHQAEFVKMLTDRENPQGRGALHGVYTMTVERLDGNRKLSIAMEDARRCARWISWACSGNLKIAERDGSRTTTRHARPDDFLILLKYREFIGQYAELLEQYGIPADTSGSRVLYDELLALRTLAQCLNDPTDTISLLAVLRGMLFGVSDEALYMYTVKFGPISLLHPQEIQESDDSIAIPTVEALTRLRGYLQFVAEETALSAFLRIVEDLGVLPYAAVQPSGAIRSGTLARLLEQLGADEQAVSNWNGLTQRLQYIAKSGGEEGVSLFAGTNRAVRIMNLHKAKGLEAPVVILACPCGDSDKDATEHIDRMSEPARGYFTVSRIKDAFNNKETIAQPIGWPELSIKERRYMRAEADRLLYVAATRAKQLLIVSRYPHRPAIDPWSALDEALSMQRELVIEEAAVVPKEAFVENFDAESALQPWMERKAASSVPSYSVVSVTELVKSAGQGEQPIRPIEGRGAAFGTVVHRCLEALGNSLPMENLEWMVRMISKEEGLVPALADDAISMLENVLAAGIWNRALTAKRRFHEFTFTVAEQAEGNSLEVIVNGVIDLVFEEEDGWVIVDFKTDTYELAYEAEFIRLYRPQVEAYARRWQEITGSNVKEIGLYFLHTNRLVSIRRDIAKNL